MRGLAVNSRKETVRICLPPSAVRMKSVTRRARIVLILPLFLFAGSGCCSLIGAHRWSHQFAGRTENFDGLEVADYTPLRVQKDESNSGRDIIITLWKSDDHSYSDIVLFCQFPLNHKFTFHGDTRAGDLDAWLIRPKLASEDPDAAQSFQKEEDNLPPTPAGMQALEARNPDRIYRMSGTIDLKIIRIDDVDNSI